MAPDFRTASFDLEFKRLVDREGGYVDNPRDPGGETMWGVTARVARAHGYTGAMRDMPLSTARTIAKTTYWDSLGCDTYDHRVAALLFDALYNGGRVIVWAQQAAGVAADNVMGPATRQALRDVNPWRFALQFCAARLIYMTGLRIWLDFGKGWARRVAGTMQESAS